MLENKLSELSLSLKKIAEVSKKKPSKGIKKVASEDSTKLNSVKVLNFLKFFSNV